MAGIAQVDASKYAHGTRARYVAGKCRCDDCRRANREYARERALERAFGRTNELVPADKARAHLLELAAQGVGRRAASAASDVSHSVLLDIRMGRKTQIRAQVEQRILTVDAGAKADGALVDKRRAATALRRLLTMGLTKAEVAARMGNQARPYQSVGKKVQLSTLASLERLVRLEEAAEVEASKLRGFCDVCDEAHGEATRIKVVRATRAWPLEQVVAEHSHYYPPTAGGRRLLMLDRKKVRPPRKETK